MRGTIIETTLLPGDHRHARAVFVSGPYGQDFQGTIVKGTMLEDGRFDLDMPFTVADDDGEFIRINAPWLCTIEEL